MKPVLHLLSVAVLCVACLLGGCGDNPRATALLSRADSLMASRPDSALLLLDSLLTDSDRQSTHFVMQCRLRRLNACNKLDTVFTAAHVAQAKMLADHFDRHGTPNEQMLAYYLLGCVYRDLGEAPQALAAYHDAVECADTTAANCDYTLLSRVYAQSAALLRSIQLPYETIEEANKGAVMGHRAGDSLIILDCQLLKADAYYLLENTDSVISVSEYASNRFLHFCDTMYSLIALKPAIVGYLGKGLLDSVKIKLDTYERLLKNKPHNVIAYSMKNINVIKAQYYLQCHQYDSASFLLSASSFHSNYTGRMCKCA